MLTVKRPSHCLKVTYLGAVFYTHSSNLKYVRGAWEVIPTPADVELRAKEWCNTAIPAIEFADLLINRLDIPDSQRIEVPVFGKGTHAFMPNEHIMQPGPVYDMVSAFVDGSFDTYLLNKGEAVSLAKNWLNTLKG